MITQRVFIHALLSLSLFSMPITSSWGAALKNPPPRLVLFLAIDQFRADTLPRFQSRFASDEGFNLLLKKGAYYPLAEYDHLQCMTAPGHATLLTGALPYQMGMPNNGWFDQKTQKRFYCTEDPATPSVGLAKEKPGMGTSPNTLLGSTVGDELKNSGYSSKVVAIALKDRAALLLGGHRADLAIWHEPNEFRWVSSKKYLPDGKLPEWIEAENKKLAENSGKTREWKAEGPGSGLSSQDFELDPKKLWGVAPKFPRTLELGKRSSLSSPYGVEITADLAVSAMKNLKLGQGKHTDLLAVSISSHDYVAHGFGPNSRESEEMTLAEDRAITRLLKEAAKQVPGGMENIVVVLSADHGGGHSPEYLKAHGVPAGRIDENLLLDRVNEKLNQKFGTPPKGQKWAPYINDFNLYLNHPALDAKSEKARFEAEEVARKVIQETEGLAAIVTATDVSKKNVPPADLGRRVLNTYYPGRSGDVVLIPRANWINATDTATHLTGYAYDRTVPIIFMGRPFKSGRYAQTAKVIDIAPTLSFILGVTPPSLSEGRVLSEALR